MIRPRAVETDQEIEDELDVQAYDSMMRELRDHGRVPFAQVIKSGINRGLALEIGPGPGYLGLEWLRQTQETSLVALEIGQAMIQVAEKNATEYGLGDRARYVQGNSLQMPFERDSFEGVFSNGSLHEWTEPVRVFQEIRRVLKPGGRYFISDLRRDINPAVRCLLYLMARPREMRDGLLVSLGTAYTLREIEEILGQAGLEGFTVIKSIVSLAICGEKPPA